MTGSSASNIYIGSAGVVSEANHLRLGTQGSSALQQNKAAIAGITGSTSASGAAVLVNSTGVMGTTTSSLRYKDNVDDMKSSSIYDLRPVTFTYKKSEWINDQDAKVKQFGLIAEEVLKLFPELVTYDMNGVINAIRYHQLIPMILKEIQKLKVEVELLKGNA